MKKSFAFVFAALLAVSGAAFAADKTAAQLEKEKALQNPYANDLGPDTIPDALLKSYPADAQKGYAVMRVKCAQCHSPSRPLNSQFIETDGKDAAARDAAAAKLKKEKPALFKEPLVSQVEGGIWQRYVKRMMSKPGCEISKDEGKVIWAFLAHDSRARKLAKHDEWVKHRKGLMEEFKKKHPKDYETLYGGKH